MFLSDLSIRRPVFATVIMLALVVLGIFSFNRLSVEEYPNVEIPVVSIVTKYAGASAQTVETEVSKKIEEAVNPIAGVKKVLSYSNEGVSTVVVEFRLEEKINEVSQEVRAKISAVRGDLPNDIEEPIIQKLDFNAMPIISIAVESDTLSTRELTDLVDKRIKKQLETVSGVGKVNLVGAAEKEVNVVVDPVRLENLGISIDSVMSGIRGENINTPLGRLTREDGEYTIRVSGKTDYVDQMSSMVVGSVDGRSVTLAEVADVIDSTEEKRTVALFNGKPAVSLDVLKQSGANIVQVIDTAVAKLEKIKKDLPEGVTVSIVRDSSKMTRDSLTDVEHTIVIGGFLTVLIVFFFINSWRSTVITGLTLPISVISSFIVIYAMGMTLNVMTLMALSLAIGMLIDDAIVVRENIVRHLEMGKDHVEASRVGTAEIGLAVLATSLTIIAVFVPVAFMKGIVGRFFFSFGITVAFAVAVSLLVSFTLDPMLSSRWHDPSIHAEGRRDWLSRAIAVFNSYFDRIADGYKGVIRWALAHRKTVIASAVVTFFAGMFLFGTLEGSFMTSYDKSEFQVSFETAPDASIHESENRLNAMLAAIQDIPEISHTYSTIGAGDSGTVRSGVIYIKLKEMNERVRKQSEIEKDVRARLKKIAGVRISIEEAGAIKSSDKPLVVNLSGEEIGKLRQYANEMKLKMAEVPGIVDIAVSMEDVTPEYRLRVNQAKAAELGLSSQDVVRTVGALVGGSVASTFEEADGDAVDIRVRLPEAYRQNPDQVMNIKLTINKADGTRVLVPLRNIATYEVDETPSEINRQALNRVVTIGANLEGMPIGTAVQKVNELSKTIPMDPGYAFFFSGEAEDMAEAFGYMAEALLLAIVMVYLVLAAQFESFFDPLAIMFSLPLSIVGMAGMLHLTGDTINIMSLIGLIMLMGLVTKNAILLIDYAKTLRRQGMDRAEALITAGRTRFRPIMMTTLAMIFGMLPLALAIGAGAEMRAPMARAVVGGLITATVLTLVVVPVVYTLLDDIQTWLIHRFFPRMEEHK